MACNWLTASEIGLALTLAVSFLFLQTSVCNAAIWQDKVITVDEAAEEDNVEEDKDLVLTNTWGIDDQKLDAAKLFWFRKVFAVETLKIKLACNLDKKQMLKLKVAAKRAARKDFTAWKEGWDEYMKQFQGMDLGLGPIKPRNKDIGREELVIEGADEIDQQILKVMSQWTFLGDYGEAFKAIDSIFWRKTVKSVLNPEQFEKYEAFLATRNQAYLDARIDSFVLMMKEKLSLSDDQAKRYDALVRPKMKTAPVAPDQLDYYVFLSSATKHDSEKMKAILNEDQYQLMKMILEPTNAYGDRFDREANVKAEGAKK